MDRDSRSPETEELRERAGSSEPSSIRPNPFDDGAANLRKRRRTSSKPDSHNRPAETDPSPSTPVLEDSTMTVDSSRTATPCSLGGGINEDTFSVQEQDSREGEVKDEDAQEPSPPPTAASHVTLSLRNPARRTVHSFPSTPSESPSPLPSPSPIRSRRPLDEDVTKLSVEPSDDKDMAAEPTGTGAGNRGGTGAADATESTDVTGDTAIDTTGPPSSPMALPDTAASPVEVIEIQADDDEVDFEPAEPQVTLLAEQDDPVPFDPTLDFPYQRAADTLAEVMTKIINYITSDVHVARNIREWIDSFLVFAKSSPFQVVYESCHQHRAIWAALPELIWGIPGVQSSAFASAQPLIRERLVEFYMSFAQLTAYFVSLDAELLGIQATADGFRPQDLLSSQYLLALAAMTKREALCKSDDCLGGYVQADDISDIVGDFVSYNARGPCGTLDALNMLLQAEAAMMPRFPRLIDNISSISVVTAAVVREAHRRLSAPNLSPSSATTWKSHIVLGHAMFVHASGALCSTLDSHITLLSYENANQQICALGDILHLSLRVDHPKAVEIVSAFQAAHPGIPSDCIADAFSMEWRFGMYCRLIKCSQMQLRVMAVTNLSQDLVHCWKRYGDQAPEAFQEPTVLRFVSAFLESTSVVSYLLGPTCHPEITAESSNIIGFLAVSQTLTNAHIDLFWQTVTTTQDPRISEVLIRTASRIVHLFFYGAALYFCKKFLVISIAAFTPSMRDFCAAILLQVCNKMAPEDGPDTVPFAVCLRLLRDSSVPGTTTPTAYPDVQSFAFDKLSELLRSVGIEADQRQSLYRSCLSDLTARSSTTLGSLCALNIISRHYGNRDLAVLASDFNLTTLVVDELENAARMSRESAFPAVLSGPTNGPRRDIIFQILKNLPYTLTTDLSARLWDIMAGPAAPCKDDRNASWRVLITCAQRMGTESNPFLTLALREFVPHLPPSCFCDGLLSFLRAHLAPSLDDKTSQLLDAVDESEQHTQSAQSSNVDRLTLEQLWRVALTAPPDTIEFQAIDFLVKDVYIESQCIRAFPLQRARNVHLALVNRCLEQLSSTAKKLKLYSNKDASTTSLTSGDDDSLVIVGSESLIQEEEVMFVRSLLVLRLFFRLYSEGSQFSVPDFRPYMPERANSVDGEPAELKYQAFDGDKQTEVLPLKIGRRNTAGSLLASIREATGFGNYRIYYGGRPLVFLKRDISRSLEDLRIHTGLILVKRDVDTGAAADSRRNSSLPSVEGEILSHFDELWGYLSMEEKLASGIYAFLSNLSVDGRFARMFEKDDVSYEQVFIVGQPYKSLYALHALKDFVMNADTRAAIHIDSTGNNGVDAAGAASITDEQTQQGPVPMADVVEPNVAEGTSEKTAELVPGLVKSMEPTSSEADSKNGGQTLDSAQTYPDAATRALRLIIAAICDPKITEVSASADLQILLKVKLIDALQAVLGASPKDNPLRFSSLDANLLTRLMGILKTVLVEERGGDAQTLIKSVFGVILEVCILSRDCWVAFKAHNDAVAVVEKVLLHDSEDVRQTAERHIFDKAVVGCGVPEADATELRRFFWPVVLGIVPKALIETTKCGSIFTLAESFMKRMFATTPPTLDVPDVLSRTGNMLLSYTTAEDFSDADEHANYGLFGLMRMFRFAYYAYRASPDLEPKDLLPDDFADRLFWKHLFPPWQGSDDDISNEDSQTGQTPYPRVVMDTSAREMLMGILFGLVDDSPDQLTNLTENMDQLVPCEMSGTEEPYHYDLPQQFDRTKVLRAPCGYAGLRNLSNTCYFNSLLTQLFMNVDFRRFMMNAEIRDEIDTQALLFQTRLLFGFLQDSVRRFVDTQMCVATVKSYDDTPIDIHNQMDVDEFYNLLFDRWEGQLQSDEEKKKFRAFYGGQLVQQVRSKECEHVSENLDPFSAIQLVIKGKATLAESLEAYVGGEVLEGDNKYKCSKCDRHVDAVKRSCLKEIPDNLIFHLKRFDFNLRMLQRSKINDYFSFPHKIDMRPYTIDHLSEPSKDHPPDMFELVGVLVHSGTAESGHYYSFIRERPSSKTGDRWVEFNDDTVSAWDPSQMEALCFGGSEFRANSQYGNHGVDGNGMLVDKAFSAYMLFYQRSSTLAQEQAALAAAELPSPVRAVMPSDLAEHIRRENTLLIRRHVLFDPKHILFVCEVLDRLRARASCSAVHVLENVAIEMAISHLDQVVSRTKELMGFERLHGRMMAMCARCARCSLAVVDYFVQRPAILRQLMQRTIEPDVRVATGNLLIQAFRKLKAVRPELYGIIEQDAPCGDEDNEGPRDRQMDDVDNDATVLRSAAYMMRTLWAHFHAIPRSWPEMFGFMTDFVNLGRLELGIFLEEDGFRRAVLAISADSSMQLDAQYARMLTAVQRRPANRPVSYESLIGLVDAMLEGMYPERAEKRTVEELFVDDNVDRFALAMRYPDIDLMMTETEFSLITRDWSRDYGNVFVEKLININQDLRSTENILVRLMATIPAMETKMFTTLKSNISASAAAGYQAPHLRAAKVFLWHARSGELCVQLLRHISEQCRGLANPEGRAYFETLRSLYYGPQPQQLHQQPQMDQEAVLRGLRFLPVWAPGLLGYHDLAVSGDVEVFLRDNVFRFGRVPEFSEEEGGVERAEAVVMAAKRLGVECLKYIRVHLVQRNVNVSQSRVAVFQRVLAACRCYYEAAPGAGEAGEQSTGDVEVDQDNDALTVTFYDLDATIPDLLKRLAVEDIEDDGSVSEEQDWDSSRCSSDMPESVGDASMHTTAELNEVDML